MIIYKVTNTVNGKLYIGKTTKSVDERWTAHVRNAVVVKRTSRFYSAIRKYGPGAFQIEILHSLPSTATAEDLNLVEMQFITEYDTMNPNIGYNMTKGGDGGASERSRQASSLLRKGRSFESLYGDRTEAIKERMGVGIKAAWKKRREDGVNCSPSDEVKARLAETLKNKWESDEEFRAKMTEGNRLRAKRGAEHHMYGKTHTSEAREIISKSTSRSWNERFGLEQAERMRKHRSQVQSGANNPFYADINLKAVFGVIISQPDKTMKELSALAGVSKPTLAKRLREKMGCSNWQRHRQEIGEEKFIEKCRGIYATLS